MPSLLQKAVMLSPISFCFFIRSGIFGLFIIFYVLVENTQPQQLRKDAPHRIFIVEEKNEYVYS